MKRVLLTLTVLLAVTLMEAQVTPIVLGDSHAMLKLMQGKKFVLLPCDMRVRNISEWMSYYKDIYPTDACQVLAIGDAGADVFKKQSLFTALYMENARIDSEVSVSSDRFYYIGQSDQNSNYTSANALYKACKQADVPFEYRCRNGLDDARTDFLTGIEYIKSNLNKF
jgi:hypothetical protein